MDSSTVSRVAPMSRSEHLVIAELSDQTLLYDTTSHELHQLDRPAAVIWRLCDGKTTTVDLAALATTELGFAVSATSVSLALDLLAERGLLREIAGPRPSRMSRRQVMSVAAEGVIVPTIVSITAPHAARAGSVVCSSTADCAGGLVCCDRICEAPSNCCAGRTCYAQLGESCCSGVCTNQLCCSGRVCNGVYGGTCNGPDPGGCPCAEGASWCPELGRCATTMQCREAACVAQTGWHWCSNPGFCALSALPCP